MTKRKTTLPLAVGIAITATALLIVMGGVAFLVYALYRGLIAAFALAPWAAALATAGGAFIGAILCVTVVAGLLRWKYRLRRKPRHRRGPGVYADRVEAEIDSRLDPDLSEIILAYPKGAATLGLAIGVAAGASKELRKLLVRAGRQFR